MEGSNENKEYFLACWTGINVIIKIPSQYGGLYPDTDLTEEMLRNFENNPPETEGITPFSYFKIKDEDGKPITNFEDNPLVLEVRYTPRAWAASSKAGGGQPRIYFRSYEDGRWAPDWVEIPVDPANVKQPGTGNPFGTLTAYLPELPDPAIGGC